jgi:hypothetical protein
MAPDDRQRRLALERELDEVTAQVITLWNRVRRIREEFSLLQDEANERQSQSALAAYRDELPSETNFSIRAPGGGMRVLMKNHRPSTLLLISLAVVVLVGITVSVWLLKR